MSILRRTIQSITFAAVCGCCSVAVFADEPKDAPAAGAAPKSAPMMSMGGMKPAKPADATDATIVGDGKAEATLTMDVRRYDFEGTKTYNRMYMPEGVVLVANKPDGVTKEPKYNGTPKYATITIGNGTPNHFTVVSDEAEGKEPKLYLDLNGDGDLTNDGTGDWTTKTDSKEGGLPSYSGTYTFTPGWKNADGASTVGQYALNFYWQPGRGQLNFYNASVRVGKINVGGKDYDVTLIENDADGLFNKLYDSTKPIVIGDKMTKPVWLLLDGDQYDIRGTFPFGGMNYLATVSDDGSKLNMTPTMKVVRVPRPDAERPTMLGEGVERRILRRWSGSRTRPSSIRPIASNFPIIAVKKWSWLTCGRHGADPA